MGWFDSRRQTGFDSLPLRQLIDVESLLPAKP